MLYYNLIHGINLFNILYAQALNKKAKARKICYFRQMGHFVALNGNTMYNFHK